MRPPLRGVIAPVVTTFDAATGELDAAAFRANLRAHLDADLAGVVIAGSTGEAALLDERERQQLVEWARPLLPADRLLIVGTGAESTRSTIRRCVEAGARGADAVLVVAPHYYANVMTSDALATHYRTVADASPVPVILYNIPKYMHFTLAPSLVAELATHGNIVGIKDSAGDMAQLGEYLKAQSDDFAVLTGHGGSLYAALGLGARGGILAVALFAADTAQEVWTTFAAGDRARSESAQARLIPLSKEIVAGLGVAGVKAAMDAVGLAGGAVRAPLRALSEADRRHVDELMRTADVASAA